jgi:hypothetical protein
MPEFHINAPQDLAAAEGRKGMRQEARERFQTQESKIGSALFAKNFAHEINGVPRAEFLQQIGPMEFDGARTNAERARDLLVGETPDDLSQHHPLPRSQGRVARE